MIKIDLDDWHEEAKKTDPEDVATKDIYDAAEFAFVASQKEGEERLATGRDKIDAMKSYPELVAAHATVRAINRFELTYRTLKTEELRLKDEELRLKDEELRLLKESIDSAATNGTTLCDGNAGMSTKDMLVENCLDIQEIFEAALDAFDIAMDWPNLKSHSRDKKIELIKENPQLFAGFYKVFWDEHHRDRINEAAFDRSYERSKKASAKGGGQDA